LRGGEKKEGIIVKLGKKKKKTSYAISSWWGRDQWPGVSEAKKKKKTTRGGYDLKKQEQMTRREKTKGW